jgi:hypothetical protein
VAIKSTTPKGYNEEPGQERKSVLQESGIQKMGNSKSDEEGEAQKVTLRLRCPSSLDNFPIPGHVTCIHLKVAETAFLGSGFGSSFRYTQTRVSLRFRPSLGLHTKHH